MYARRYRRAYLSAAERESHDALVRRLVERHRGHAVGVRSTRVAPDPGVPASVTSGGRPPGRRRGEPGAAQLRLTV